MMWSSILAFRSTVLTTLKKTKLDLDLYRCDSLEWGIIRIVVFCSSSFGSNISLFEQLSICV